MTYTIYDELIDEAEIALRWLTEMALPVWGTRGFDSSTGSFHEKLDFSLNPSETNVPLRVMVQARQIAVFSAAALSGRYPEGRDIALIAAENMISRYEQADGAAGWVFAVDRSGTVIDNQRDLYAHAFVLFGLAWASRLEKRESFNQAIERTLTFLQAQMADKLGLGYWDTMPRSDVFRRQNPHMHLFEAFITLFETRADKGILILCDELYELATEHLMAESNGALREVFHEDWSVAPVEGEGSVEPGHLFEWAWLLRRYSMISTRDTSSSITALLNLAVNSGVDPSNGRIIDEISEAGCPVRSSSRSWPHAEALKGLSSTDVLDRERTVLPLLTKILRRLTTKYCPPTLEGGWQDHFDEFDHPIRKDVPASTFYHLFFGIVSVHEFIKSYALTGRAGR